MLIKDREDPELSFLAGLSAQTKLEVKAKIELKELSWLSVRVPTRSQSGKGGEMEFLFARDPGIQGNRYQNTD